jgi:hypothetical protein
MLPPRTLNAVTFPRAIILGLAVWLVLANFQQVIADGGVIRLSEKKGDYRITVFTAPNPFRAGPVEISVLVQDEVTGDPAPDVKVVVEAAPADRSEESRHYEATSGGATNKLFQAATFELSAAGAWNFAVQIDGKRGSAQVDFAMEAGDRLPRWLSLWPWFSWPFLVVLLFAAHQALTVNQTRSRPTPEPRPRLQPRHG